ncbi:hypothetical protein [Pseudosulfitobacter pseudonitzschiae]|uniref:hypothetical protein n=1 Tax=Pseudosulfitobacter pseudonitzschiae TaxID=1402135 RepID=UPI001E467765|nr:hypothetical protein [Pseudosulfitobacter pseudonitzschiae]UFF53348.1 hypothetical protein LOE12_24050 [Pseudosulfitobacter pseudonitzschiae]
MRFQECRSQCLEGLQGVLQRQFGIVHPGVTSRFRLAPGLADDPVMGLDHGVSNGAAPFQSTNRKDGETAVTEISRRSPAKYRSPS